MMSISSIEYADYEFLGVEFPSVVSKIKVNWGVFNAKICNTEKWKKLYQFRCQMKVDVFYLKNVFLYYSGF